MSLFLQRLDLLQVCSYKSFRQIPFENFPYLLFQNSTMDPGATVKGMVKWIEEKGFGQLYPKIGLYHCIAISFEAIRRMEVQI